MRYKSPIFDPVNAGLDLLSRIKLHSSLHDTGFVSAFRPEYDEAQNEQRDKWLTAFLVEKGYYLLAVMGSINLADSGKDQPEYVKQFSFVTDWSGKINLEENLRSMGEEFRQEHILFKPRKENDYRLISKRESVSAESDNQTCLVRANDSGPTRMKEPHLRLIGPIRSVTYAGNNWTRHLASMETKLTHP